MYKMRNKLCYLLKYIVPNDLKGFVSDFIV